MAIMAKITKDHKKNKENPFVATVTWGPDDDIESAKRLMQIHDKLESYGIKDGFAFYLVGKRTTIVIGFTDDSMNIEKFSLFMTLKTNIKVEPCYVVEAHELVEVIKDKFK